jgi:hypothetical protein
VVTPARGDVAVGFQNRTSFRDGNFGKLHGARTAALDEGVSARGADVTYPLRALAEHRDQVALPVVLRDD